MRLAVRIALLTCSLALAGCAGSYPARPSPRLELVSDGAVAKNGQVYPLSAWGGGLVEAVRGNEPAEQEAHSYESEQTAGTLVGYVGTAATIASIAMFAYASANPTSNNPQAVETFNNADIAVFAGGMAVYLIAAGLKADARQHLYNTIHLYNDSLPPDGMPRPGMGYPGYPGGPQPPPYGGPQGFAPSVHPATPRPLVPWATAGVVAATR